MKYTIAFSLLLLCVMQSVAQEALYPLNVNPALTARQFDQHHLRRAFADTVTLPFIDDFSFNSMYPIDSLWVERDVYINNNYSESPVTIGVATFDGLDEFGRPYHPTSNFDSVADYLTSQPIHFNFAPGDTNVWLSFFYQPQGLGDIPESGDSLVLQFRDTGGVWNNVWAEDGRGDTAFRRVDIRITDGKYFYDGFQFRYYNIATVNGNRDHWNLDYVILRATPTPSDLPDYSLLHPPVSLLNEFTSMPYTHYKEPGIATAAMKSSITDTIRVFNYGSTTIFPFLNITDSLGLDTTFNYSPWIVGTPLSDSTYTIGLNNFEFPAYPGDSMDFLVRCYSNAPINQYTVNDTSYLRQHFYNYYSYDDGSAEWAYAVTGSVDVWIAYQFDIKKQDTLRGIQIYFNPTGVDVTNRLFQIAVWTNVDPANHTQSELYRTINQKPDSFDGINAFKTYLFDSLLVVGPGNIWVGIIQNEPQTLYGIGFDKNTDSHNKLFTHFDGFWYQSNIPGSLMLRPVFGDRISLVGVDEIVKNEPSFSLYPNPASDHLFITTNESKECSFQIYNSLGSLIQHGRLKGSGQVDIEGLATGIYVMRLTGANNVSSTRKFVVE